MAIQMKATEQYFPGVNGTVLYKVFLLFASVDEILKPEQLKWNLLHKLYFQWCSAFISFLS